MTAVRAWNLIAGLGLVAGLSACSPAEPSEPQASPEATAGEAASVEGTWTADEEGDPFLEFSEGDAVTGSDGCNGITTTYSVDGTTVTLEPFTTTLKACSGVDPWLSDISTATIEGDELVVMDEAGTEIGRLERG